MAPWGDAKLIFCFLFISCCCTVTLAEVPVDCCLDITDRTIHKSAVADFRKQYSGQGCSLDATILVTRNGFELCAPANEHWVQEVEKHVVSLKKHCKRVNYKSKRCVGVRPVKK
ncbi:C-C motif chemokine 19a.1 [Notolabrus celidotus]|uniref:C-C motif chemokine 19a.1 n=1 Tax=Notolabrus celidotus TaxID=1203425 RepID=UPI00149013E5|nr:C-C motif chemokine 19a.1 [Notolabrus celidotus]